MRHLLAALALLALVGCQHKTTTAPPPPTPSPTTSTDRGPWDRAELGADQRTLTLHFVGFCGANESTYKAVTEQSKDRVVITVLGARPFSNLCAGEATERVTLDAPLGARTVQDGYDHHTRLVTQRQHVGVATGGVDVPAPVTWSYRSGRIDLHYVQIYEVFSTSALPSACHNEAGTRTCGLRLDALGPGGEALIVKNGRGLPGGSYKRLVGTPVTIGGRASLALGDQPCSVHVTCTTYAVPIGEDDWFELMLSPATIPDETANAILDGVVLRGL